jgi:hypothetical protein
MNERPTLMVSSTVYGHEEELDVIYAILNSMKYEVWMSHKGTVPVFSDKTAFENCLEAVEKCDLFLGVITPEYGSGIAKGELSITHQEMIKAIELKKPRWFLAHDKVVFARALLNDLGYKTTEERDTLKLKSKAKSIGDLRVIQMYEEATMESLPLDDRQGNWVQKFIDAPDINLFVMSQFSRYEDIKVRLEENFKNINQLKEQLKSKGGLNA